MLATYQNPVYDYERSPDQDTDLVVHHPVIVVGGGPVGLAAGLDAGVHGMDVLVLDESNTVSVGSRAVCYSKRSLEIFNRWGCASRMVDKGVTWKVGKIFFRDRLIRQFDLLPAPGHEQPAFINLQQYYLEQYMVDRLRELDSAEIRWKNKVVDVTEEENKVTITVDTPDGPYSLSCDWLIVADGANSGIRSRMGLESEGQIFQDRFLIVDVVMKQNAPPERWFSFDPSYHRGWSTLLHRQADDVYRLDFQLGWDADPVEEKKPENIIPRVTAMLGEDVDFELEWASVYTFTCRRMEKFRHGRLLYTGDAAHQVSPFGARGANSGFQDIDNLIWKLDLVLRNEAPSSMLDSYCSERVMAAEENIMNSTRSTDFITPKSPVSSVFRDAVLELAEEHEFAQLLTNSGRLSDPAILVYSPLNTPDTDEFSGDMVPGAPLDDAPVNYHGEDKWLLNMMGGAFNLLYFIDNADDFDANHRSALIQMSQEPVPVIPIVVANRGGPIDEVTTVLDVTGMANQRFDGHSGAVYLIRPDQHVLARCHIFDMGSVSAALNRILIG